MSELIQAISFIVIVAFYFSLNFNVVRLKKRIDMLEIRFNNSLKKRDL